LRTTTLAQKMPTLTSTQLEQGNSANGTWSREHNSLTGTHVGRSYPYASV
jgi:hypothetical protein